MASSREKFTKDGKRFYEIRVSRGRGQTYLTKRWYVPEGWSKKAIDKELGKVAAEFERQAHTGEAISLTEKRQWSWSASGRPLKSSRCASMGSRFSCQ